MEKYTSLDRRSPRPYLFLAAIFAVMTGLCYAARSSEGLGFFLSWYLAIDPDVTAKECAVGLTLMAVLAASPSLRKIAVSTVTYGVHFVRSFWIRVPNLTATTEPYRHGQDFRWQILGGLRYLLALDVAVSHTRLSGVVPTIDGQSGSFGAVMGFFMLSGYSMCHSIIGKPDPRDFYRRRAMRILPLSFVANLLALIVLWVKGPAITAYTHEHIVCSDWWGILVSFLVLQGWLAMATQYNGPLWSLGLEWVYYAVTPWLYRRSTKLILVLFALSAYWYVHHIRINDWNWVRASLGMGGLSLFWAWLAGFLYYRHQDRTWAKALLLLAPLLLISIQNDYAYWSNSPAVAGFAAFLLMVAPDIRISKKWAERLYFLGEISYPLYVVHFPIILLFVGLYPKQVDHFEIAALCILVPQIAAIAAYFLIDYPLRIKRRKPTSYIAAGSSATDATSPASTQAEPTGSPLKAPS